MDEERIRRAAELLANQRPVDYRYATRSEQIDAYCIEIRDYLQVQAAVKMAGLDYGRRRSDFDIDDGSVPRC